MVLILIIFLLEEGFCSSLIVFLILMIFMWVSFVYEMDFLANSYSLELRKITYVLNCMWRHNPSTINFLLESLPFWRLKSLLLESLTGRSSLQPGILCLFQASFLLQIFFKMNYRVRLDLAEICLSVYWCENCRQNKPCPP
jgi:hypothetical protein